MLSVSVQKDIGEYEPKLMLHMTTRSLVCTGGACLLAIFIAVWVQFVLFLPFDFATPIILITALPVWALGFIKPCGLKAEVFTRLWLRHMNTRKPLFYRSHLFVNKHTQGKAYPLDPEYERIKKLKGSERLTFNE